MTTDINGNVVGIQGNPVVAETLGASQDGYVLTWDNTDGYLAARPVSSPAGTLNNNAYFTSSGTWTCPVGVTSVLCIGAGGGGGGGAGHVLFGGAGGGGALQQTSYITVAPGTVYTITIGAGGNGGTSGSNGNDGSATIISYSSINCFYAIGAGGGTGGAQVPSYVAPGGVNFAGIAGFITTFVGSTLYSIYPTTAASGGFGGGNNSSLAPIAGFMNYVGGYSGGSPGSTSGGHYYAGGGGGAGPQGIGGAGGASSNGGTAGDGVNAFANTSAGGGGGGASNGGTSGDGGAGGSGYLTIVW